LYHIGVHVQEYSRRTTTVRRHRIISFIIDDDSPDLPASLFASVSYNLLQMSSEIDSPCRRIPSLVYYCRRGQPNQLTSRLPSLCSYQPAQWRLPMLVVSASLMGESHRLNLLFLIGIVSLGDNVSYELVRPILESCSADNLRRLEDATPVSCPY
jgi:hypothetical protein